MMSQMMMMMVKMLRLYRRQNYLFLRDYNSTVMVHNKATTVMTITCIKRY